MSSLASLIATDIDYERPGFQTGMLRLPWSHDRSAYGHIPIPLVVLSTLKVDDDPTVLLTGGNHGDEYEGPVALMKLMQRLPTLDIRGRLIVIPGLNFPAFTNGSRTSPIDGGNLNRLFAGARHYVYALHFGVFEPAFALNDDVRAGQLAGRLFDPHEQWRAPREIAFRGDGYVMCVRTVARVEAGDCIALLASETSLA